MAVVVAAALALARPLLPWSEAALVWTMMFPSREAFNFEGQLLCTSNVIRIGQC